jgi:hypothetical protein
MGTRTAREWSAKPSLVGPTPTLSSIFSEYNEVISRSYLQIPLNLLPWHSGDCNDFVSRHTNIVSSSLTGSSKFLVRLTKDQVLDSFMPGCLSGDRNAFVMRHTNIGGSSPSPGSVYE